MNFMKTLLTLHELLCQYKDELQPKKYQQNEYANDMLDFLLRYSQEAFLRNNPIGHFTASAFVISPDETSLLLTHHKKLNIWIQLGGHSDGCDHLLEVCLNEVFEESGLSVEQLHVLNNERIFDIDIHQIPFHAKTQTPAHLHFDVRFLLKSTSWDLQINEESYDLKWVKMTDIETDIKYQSIAPDRILPKIKRLLINGDQL
jgi:8-oxo-dGTP pyrophosphatase MutT (NUDIX family)